MFYMQYKIDNMVFSISKSRKLKIDKIPMENMLSYAQDSIDKKEAGGVVLGRFIKDSNDIVIDINTFPMKGDIRTRTRFKRGKRNHQKIIDEIWKESEGTCNYLGEWHTHPEENPTPSTTDMNSWKKILKNDVYTSKHLYFIIIGTKSIGVWEGSSKTLEIKKIKQYE